MPMLSRTGWTVERLAELPDDGNRYEIIDGELFVTPAPALLHQNALLDLVQMLGAYARDVDLALAFAPVDIPFAEGTSVQPDLLVMPLSHGKRPRAFTDVGVLVLALEILSPSTARRDRTVKRVMYQKYNVPEYWIVDIDARTIEVWRPDDEQPHVCRERLVWQPSPTHQPLSLDLLAFFAGLD